MPKAMLLGAGPEGGGDWAVRAEPHEWIQCCCERDPTELPEPLPPCGDTAGSRQSAAQQRAFTTTPPDRHHDVGLAASRTMRNKLLLCISH